MLENKRCIITGSGAGMGADVARVLRSKGARVMLSDTDESALKAMAAALDCPCFVTDLLSRESCKNLVDETVKAFGGVDIYINLANMQTVLPLGEFPEDTWDQMLGMLLTAPFLLTKYVWPHMQAQKWGRIIYFNSIHGLVASEEKVAYIAAKHGLSGLTKAAAVEGGRYEITVNSICPSYVWSPGTEKQIKDTAARLQVSEKEALENNLLQKSAIKTLIDPQEVVETIHFLCTDAAKHITGSLLTMDGGYTAS